MPRPQTARLKARPICLIALKPVGFGRSETSLFWGKELNSRRNRYRNRDRGCGESITTNGPAPSPLSEPEPLVIPLKQGGERRRPAGPADRSLRPARPLGGLSLPPRLRPLPERPGGDRPRRPSRREPGPSKPLRGGARGPLKLLARSDGSRCQLYDLESDPRGMRDLDPFEPCRVDRVRSRLLDWAAALLRAGADASQARR